MLWRDVWQFFVFVLGLVWCELRRVGWFSEVLLKPNWRKRDRHLRSRWSRRRAGGWGGWVGWLAGLAGWLGSIAGLTRTSAGSQFLHTALLNVLGGSDRPRLADWLIHFQILRTVVELWSLRSLLSSWSLWESYLCTGTPYQQVTTVLLPPSLA
jgi:hypothetical protein